MTRALPQINPESSLWWFFGKRLWKTTNMPKEITNTVIEIVF